MAMEDNDIIQMFFDRDENAIKEMSIKYGNYCTSIAKNILKNNEDAEECVNDTYLKVWNVIPPSRPNMLKAFIGRITRNISFNLYKKMNTDKRGNLQIPIILDELSECVSDGITPYQEIEKKELLKAINSFLEKMPQEKRVMFVRRYWYSDSITDIAKRCGVSENSVSVNLNRLRKRLHNYLIERGFEL